MSELSDLMQKDPLSLTKEDVEAIVQHFRENRERYVQGQKSLKIETVKTPKAKGVKGTADLSDLDIEI